MELFLKILKPAFSGVLNSAKVSLYIIGLWLSALRCAVDWVASVLRLVSWSIGIFSHAGKRDSFSRALDAVRRDRRRGMNGRERRRLYLGSKMLQPLGEFGEIASSRDVHVVMPNFRSI